MSIDLDWLDAWSYGNARPRAHGNGLVHLKDDTYFLTDECICLDAAHSNSKRTHVIDLVFQVDVHDDAGNLIYSQFRELP